MIPCQLVLVDVNGQELIRGPFNQGIVFESRQPGVLSAINVADRQEIARASLAGIWYAIEANGAPIANRYKQCFVQSYVAQEEHAS